MSIFEPAHEWIDVCSAVLAPDNGIILKRNGWNFLALKINMVTRKKLTLGRSPNGLTTTPYGICESLNNWGVFNTLSAVLLIKVLSVLNRV